MVEYRLTLKDGTEVKLRELREGDERELMRFINPFVDEHRSGILVNKRLSLEDEKKWLMTRLSGVRSRKVVDLAVEHEGSIKGNCDIERLPWKFSHRGVMGIAISKELRGKGLGEIVMRKTIELAVKRMKGLESLELSAFSYNERALSLYKRLGFEEFGRMPRSAKEDGEYFESVLMIMHLE